MDQRVTAQGEAHVGDGVEGPQMAHIDQIADPCLLGVVALNDAVAHLAVEIAVGTQDRLGHRGTQFGIHAAHQHGLLTERGGHPLGKAALLVVIGIPYQQVRRERETQAGTSEEGSVRLGGQ